MEKPAKILVMEDDQDIGNMFKMILEYKGYTVIVFGKYSAGYVDHAQRRH